MVDQAEIHRMARSEDVEERCKAIEFFKNDFPNIENKTRAWTNILNLTKDNDETIRWEAASSIGSVFPHIPNKSQGWSDLKELTHDINCSVRFGAAMALGTAFSYIPDKMQGWFDLHRLAQDDDYWLRMGAASSIGVSFSIIPNKSQAWSDLYKLSQDIYEPVRKSALEAIGVAYPYIPTNFQGLCLCFLLRFSKDVDINMNIFANYSLGRISIHKAIESDGEQSFKNELENALKFFEKASILATNQITYSNPAKFCLPFYRSFYALTFKKEEAKAELKKYLAEAKRAVGGSHSKEKLLEAVENLGNALKEAQNLKEKDFNGLKCDLNTYKRYCERAVDMLDSAEEKAPGATRLMRRRLPIIDERIKEIIAEIQEKAKALCKNTRDTPFENLGKDVNRAGQCLAQIRDPISLEKRVQTMQNALSAICARMPVEERGDACELLSKANVEQYVEDKLELINIVLSKIPSQIGNVTNIQISNSNNIQITTANGTTQKISIETSEEKTIK